MVSIGCDRQVDVVNMAIVKCGGLVLKFHGRIKACHLVNQRLLQWSMLIYILTGSAIGS